MTVSILLSAFSFSSQMFVFDATARLEQTCSSDKHFFQTDTPSALGGLAIEKDYSPLYLSNPLPPPASSIFPPFLLPSLPLRFPLQIFPFSSCHCVQFVPEISPSNKGQIMTERLCYCVYTIVCACVFFFSLRSSHDFTISSCTSLVSLSSYICVWPFVMLSFPMIFFFNFSPSQTLLHRICLTPSKRNKEMRGLFPPLFLFSLQPNYIPLLLCLPFPLLQCLSLGGVNQGRFSGMFLISPPAYFTDCLFTFLFPSLLLSQFSIHSSCVTSDTSCLNLVHYTFLTKLKFIFRVDLILSFFFFLKKKMLSSRFINGNYKMYSERFGNPRLLLVE